MPSKTRPAISLFLLANVGCGTQPPLPPEAATLNARGAEALAQGDLQTAGARLSLALEYSPRFVEALVNLGLVEQARGNPARARQLFGRARRLNPDLPHPHHALGVLDEQASDAPSAAAHYREALAVDPGFPAARANLARLLFSTGHVDHALVEFKKLTEVSPEDAAGRRGLVECLLATGRLDEAARHIEAGRRNGPGGTFALLHARLLLLEGNPGRALRDLMPLSQRLDETGAAARAWIAVAELSLGEPRRALNAAQAALGLSEDDPVAIYAMATALEALGHPAATAWRRRASARGVTVVSKSR